MLSIRLPRHSDNTYNDVTYNDVTYNDVTYNDITYNNVTYNRQYLYWESNVQRFLLDNQVKYYPGVKRQMGNFLILAFYVGEKVAENENVLIWMLLEWLLF